MILTEREQLDRANAEIERLRAALAQKAEPVEQEAMLQKIADFGQDQEREPARETAAHLVKGIIKRSAT